MTEHEYIPGQIRPVPISRQEMIASLRAAADFASTPAEHYLREAADWIEKQPQGMGERYFTAAVRDHREIRDERINVAEAKANRAILDLATTRQDLQEAEQGIHELRASCERWLETGGEVPSHFLDAANRAFLNQDMRRKRFITGPIQPGNVHSSPNV